METADPARLCARCGAPAAMQPSLADPAAGQLTEDARPGTGNPHPEIARTAGGDRATPPSVLRPPIRREVAFAGAGTALLAGAAGLVSGLLLYTSSDPAVYFFGLAAYLVSTGIAVAALRRIDLLVITGLLQGMCWQAVAYVAADIALFSVDHMFGLTGLYLAALWVGVISDVLGAGAAVLLLISWGPAVGWRRVSRLRPLPVMLVCGVGLSQIASLIVVLTQQGEDAFSETSAIAGLLVGLAVTWYAVNLRARVLGGALVLGWSTVAALWSLVMSPYTAIGILSSILLAAVMVLALIHPSRYPASDLASTNSPPPPHWSTVTARMGLPRSGIYAMLPLWMTDGLARIRPLAGDQAAVPGQAACPRQGRGATRVA